jgi:WD40 repeat protein
VENRCLLYKLLYPTGKSAQFKVTLERTYQQEGYASNSWHMQLASNGRHLLAPTHDGLVCFFDLNTAKLVAFLQVSEKEVRKILLFPTKPLLVATGDGNLLSFV